MSLGGNDRIAVTLLGICLAVVLSGCGAEEVPPTTVPTEPPVQEVPFATEPEKLAYAGVSLTVAPGVEADSPVADVCRQAAEVFEARTGAQVAFQWGSDAGGDIYYLPWGADAAGALDLSALAQGTDYEAHSFETLRQQVVNQYGALAGIPQVPYAGGVYYRTEAFDTCGIEAPPQTWADFVEVCQVLESNGWETLSLNTEDCYQAAWLHFERGLGESGLGQAGQVELQTEKIIELQAAGLLAPSDYPDGQNRLALSNAVMTVGTNALCGEIGESTLMDLSWGVFPWPGDGAGTGCYGYSDLLCISASTANPQAAFDFVMLLCTGEFDQLRADVTDGIPADPGNVSPIRGAFSILNKAVRTQIPAATGKQNTAAQRLWAGKYKTEKDFSKVWFDPAE